MITDSEYEMLNQLANSLGVKNPKDGALRIWHVPQIPCEPFYVAVENLPEAVKIMNILAAYDAFQLTKEIKPDYCNASGLEIFLDGEWVDWYDDNYDSIEDWKRNELF